MAAEREKAYKLAQALKAAVALTSRKDDEVERAIQARHWVEGELEVARTALVAAETKALVDLAATQAEAAKEVEKEFRVGFFQGYSDLKRKVALVHPEWDLSSFSGAKSDY